jgi:hypothetical protein
MAVQGRLKQIVLETSISKITREKWTRDMAQVVKCLLCKGKAPSSNPSPTKNKQTNKQTNTTSEFYQIL